MIFIKNKKEVKYIKKLNKDVIKKQISSNIKALSFNELNNPTEILNFINNCKNRCSFKYYKENIKDIILNQKYLAYIYYENDNPLGYIIAYIHKKENMKILEIENIGVLTPNEKRLFELEFMKIIMLKAWNKKNIDKVIITFKSQEKQMKKIMNDLNFNKNK